MQWFYARTERKPVEQITRRDVLAFKDKLLSEGQSVTNTNMKLSRLRTLLGWAYQNDLAPANVAEGISVKVADSGKSKRLPFAPDELQAIFASPVYASGERPKGRKAARGKLLIGSRCSACSPARDLRRSDSFASRTCSAGSIPIKMARCLRDGFCISLKSPTISGRLIVLRMRLVNGWYY